MEKTYQANVDAVESAVQMNEENFKVDYYHPYGKPHFHCLDITVAEFRMVMEYYTPRDDRRNQIITRIYHLHDDHVTRQFMIQKKDASTLFPNLLNSYGEYHRMEVTYEDWGYRMLDAVKAVKDNQEAFLKMCRNSCPFNPDGTNRHKDWKTTASLEITSSSNNELVQGVKGGDTPGGRYAGGNGSFVTFGKVSYELKVTLKCLSYEKPIREYEVTIDVDEYIRNLKEKLGRTKLPYELLNECLPDNVEVFTTDMEEEPEDREFRPAGYGNSWFALLDAAFKNLAQ